MNKKSKETFGINSDAVRQLAQILVETDLSEIEYESDGSRVKVVRQRQQINTFIPETILPSTMIHHPSVHERPVTAAIHAPTTDLTSHPGLIKSPMVGTVYLSPEPGAPSFVRVGEPVEVGQTIMIIEAMKVMNPIKSTKSGKVLQLCVSDATPVEFDQPLLVIE